MSGHNDELIDELRGLRIKLGKEIVAMEDAARTHEERKSEVRATRRSIEEVLEEIETGRSGRPLIDAAIAAQTQTGARPIPSFDAPPVETIDRTTDRPVAGEDLDALVVHACRHHSTELREWFAEITEAGVDDRDLYIGLRRHWPISRVFVRPDRTGRRTGYTMATVSAELRFWVGPYLGHNHIPALGGQPLLDAIRRVMGVPMPTVPAEPTTAEEMAAVPPVLPAGQEIPGFRAAGEAEWLATPEDRRSAHYRMVLDGDDLAEPSAAEKPARKAREKARKA